MRELPGGTVTFLFTDVEGSTALLHELGADRYAEALAEHRRVLRGVVDQHGGVEVDTQGDAFFVAFRTAPAAVAAAADAQARLGAAPVRVRMGLHTGTPLVTDEGYVGADVHRAARIAAAGSGGQVLLSRSTRDLVDADVRDLGDHRLKDLQAPERIFQLGSAEFPSLKTLFGTNLPVPATPFLGRGRELADIIDLLSRQDVRLVTLTGAGGSGKTRLALAAARASAAAHPDGVWWVPLASVRDPALVLDQVRHAVGLQGEVAAGVAHKRMLLLLDNFEQLLRAAGEVAALVERCPNLRLLVTSREPLRLAGEREYVVPPLSEKDAVALFSDRAVEAGAPGTVRAICRRLDCLPLATELAAARTRVLSPEQILERLDRRLPLLTGGPRDAPERQQTLRGTIEWSHDLLTRDEQRTFARLAVFAGGCTFGAAEAVADADLDTLQSLVEKNLLRHTGERFWMLETIHEYALERLEDARDARDLRDRHAEWCSRLAAEADGLIRTPYQAKWLARLDEERANLRGALSWLLATRAEDALQLLVDLDFYLGHSGQIREADRWYAEALEKTTGRETLLRARALREAAGLAAGLGDRDRADRLRQECVAIARRLGDKREEAAALGGLGRYEESLELFRELGDGHGISGALNGLAIRRREGGDVDGAEELLRECLELEATRASPFHRAAALHSVGDCRLHAGDLSGASALYRESLLLARGIGSAWCTQACLAGFAAVAARRDQRRAAATLWGAAERVEELLGVPMAPEDRVPYERVLEPVLTDARAASARAAGHELEVERAIEYALTSAT